MEFLAQYDDISDGENEAEMQAQLLVSAATQQITTAYVHSEHRELAGSPEAEVEAVETESSEERAEESSDISAEDVEEVKPIARIPLPGMLSDLHYAAIASGLYEPAQTSVAEV